MITQEKIEKWFSRKQIEVFTEYHKSKSFGRNEKWNYRKEKWYDYVICDYCRAPVKFFPKERNRKNEGGEIILPSSLTGREKVKIVVHDKCIKILIKEIEKIRGINNE